MCVARDVERHAEKKIRAALVKLAAQAPVPADVKLKQRVARRERDFVRLGGIPAGNDQPAGAGIAANFRDHGGNLVEAVGGVRAVGLQRRAEIPPLMAVNRSEIAFFSAEARALLRRAPLVPDRDAAFPQPAVVRAAAEKPKQLLDD